MTTCRPKRAVAEAALSLLGGGQKRTTMADYREERLDRMGWLGTLPDDVVAMLVPYLLRDSVSEPSPVDNLFPMLALGGPLAEAALEPRRVNQLLRSMVADRIFGLFRSIRELAHGDTVQRLHASVVAVEPEWTAEWAASLRPELLTRAVHRLRRGRRAVVMMLSGDHDAEALELMLTATGGRDCLNRSAIQFGRYDLLTRVVAKSGVVPFDYEYMPKTAGCDDFLRAVFNHGLYASSLRAATHACQIIRVGRLDHLKLLATAVEMGPTNQEQMLLQATARSHVPIIQWLFETYPDVRVDLNTMEHAVMCLSFDVVRALTPRCSEFDSVEMLRGALNCEDERIFHHLMPLFDPARVASDLDRVQLDHDFSYRRILDTPVLCASLGRTDVLHSLCMEAQLWSTELHEELEAAGAPCVYSSDSMIRAWRFGRCVASAVYISKRAEFRARPQNVESSLEYLLRHGQTPGSHDLLDALVDTGLVTESMLMGCLRKALQRELPTGHCIWPILDKLRFQHD